VDTAQILKIQQELARCTLENNKRLYRLVCDAGWLRALDAVFANKGSHTPGLNGITKQHVDGRQRGRERLVEQLQELLTGEYRPQPVKRIYIPKANGKLRPLGIATLQDRVVQAALKMVLEPIYESVFHPFSWVSTTAIYSSRPQCITPRTCRPHGVKWIIEGDIAACFDEIDHRLRCFLKKRIQDPQILDLVTRMLRCGIWNRVKLVIRQ